jgi:hypothetical protein
MSDKKKPDGKISGSTYETMPIAYSREPLFGGPDGYTPQDLYHETIAALVSSKVTDWRRSIEDINEQRQKDGLPPLQLILGNYERRPTEDIGKTE